MNVKLYSRTKNIVHILKPCESGMSNFSGDKCLETIVTPTTQVSRNVWRKIKALQGTLSTYYLKLRYGGPNTFLLLAYSGDQLVHMQWLVPAKKIGKRYSFVTSGSYAIIACLTASEFRGKGIYATKLKFVTISGLSAGGYWIWASIENASSLKGIKKAGAKPVGSFIQTKFLWGVFSKIVYKKQEA